jgi:hypothetical protein
MERRPHCGLHLSAHHSYGVGVCAEMYVSHVKSTNSHAREVDQFSQKMVGIIKAQEKALKVEQQAAGQYEQRDTATRPASSNTGDGRDARDRCRLTLDSTRLHVPNACAQLLRRL